MVDRIGDFERKLKEGEPGFIRVGTKTYDDLFFDELHRFEQKYTHAHKPFDRACARIDFLDKFQAIQKEIERTEGSVDIEDKRLKIDFGDLDKYAIMERFNKLGETEDTVNRNIDGMIMPVQISVTELFICKQRGHRIAVQVPLDKWKERKLAEIKVSEAPKK